jgi:hypothetical protein
MYAYCQDMPGNTEEMQARLDEQIGPNPIAGIVAHVSGPIPGGWHIINVWESEEALHEFQTQRLFPALRVVTEGVPGPQMPFDFRDVTGVDSLSRIG